MIELKITPGPFTVDPIEHGCFAISAPDHFQLAKVYCVELPNDAPDCQEMKDRALANAKAFAATPDLIAALWEISQRVAHKGGDTSQAERALMKAMGA